MTLPRLPDQAGSAWASEANTSRSRFINPHRLFHGVWLPQWLEERPEVSEKAKKLYAYLTYFAGGKGHAWPSFNHLGEKLHVSRRYVIKLVQELSAHRLIAVTNINNPRKGHCANVLPFSLASVDADRSRRRFRMAARGKTSRRFRTRGAGIQTAHTLVNSRSLALVNWRTPAPSEGGHCLVIITPLVIPSSPKENNKKRTKIRGRYR